MALLFCSTIVPRFSVIAPTSLMEAAVSSAAAARSSAFPETPRTDAPISISDADVCSTDEASAVASSLILLTLAAICVMATLDSSAELAMLVAGWATCLMEPAVSSIAAAFWAIYEARLAVFAATCSIDAAISLTPETSSSVEEAILSACAAVSPSEVAIASSPDTASSSDLTCASAPSWTSSAIRAMPLAEAVNCAACPTTSRGSKCVSTVPWPLPFPSRRRTAMTVLQGRRSGRRYRIFRSQQLLEIEDDDHPVAHRRDTGDRGFAALAERIRGRVDRRRIDAQEFAAGVDEQADAAPAHVDDEDPRAQVDRCALEPEPRAHVDRRDDLAAGKHHAVDERRRVGHPRNLLDEVDEKIT